MKINKKIKIKITIDINMKIQVQLHPAHRLTIGPANDSHRLQSPVHFSATVGACRWVVPDADARGSPLYPPLKQRRVPRDMKIGDH